MYPSLKDNLILFSCILSVIFITQAIVFMAVSYCLTGDCFLALRNFYNLAYNLGV